MGLSPEERRKRHAVQSAERDAAYAATGRKKRPKGRAPKDKEWDAVVGEWIPTKAGSTTSSVPAGSMETDDADASLQFPAVLLTPIARAVPHHPTAAAQLSAVTSAEAARAVPFSHPWAETLPVLVRSSEAEPLNWAQRLENMGFIAGHCSYTFAEETVHVLSSAGRARRHSVQWCD